MHCLFPRPSLSSVETHRNPRLLPLCGPAPSFCTLSLHLLLYLPGTTTPAAPSSCALPFCAWGLLRLFFRSQIIILAPPLALASRILYSFLVPGALADSAEPRPRALMQQHLEEIPCNAPKAHACPEHADRQRHALSAEPHPNGFGQHGLTRHAAGFVGGKIQGRDARHVRAARCAHNASLEERGKALTVLDAGLRDEVVHACRWLGAFEQVEPVGSARCQHDDENKALAAKAQREEPWWCGTGEGRRGGSRLR